MDGISSASRRRETASEMLSTRSLWMLNGRVRSKNAISWACTLPTLPSTSYVNDPLR